MFKHFRDKIVLSGFTVLIIGVALLVFTFVSAYGFLAQSLSIVASDDLVQTFGGALGPLIATCIRIMYLGVMGWIGSLVTIRGVTIIAHTPQTSAVVQEMADGKKQLQASQKVKAEKSQKETKPAEPEFLVIPPERASASQTERRQAESEEGK